MVVADTDSIVMRFMIATPICMAISEAPHPSTEVTVACAALAGMGQRDVPMAGLARAPMVVALAQAPSAVMPTEATLAAIPRAANPAWVAESVVAEAGCAVVVVAADVAEGATGNPVPAAGVTGNSIDKCNLEGMRTMFYDKRNFKGPHMGVSAKFTAITILVAGMACFPAPAAAQQPGQKTFPFVPDATKALVAALRAGDQPALLSILGPDAKNILSSGDEVQDKNDRDEFVQKYEEMHRIVAEPDGKTTLYIGPENWPSPIPLAVKNGNWYFDTPAAKREILYRRVGKNELATIQVCRELVDAEKEYSSQAHDNGSSHQYAQKIFSDPGKHNGLYWPVSSGEAESPIGPLVASAAAEGYVRDPNQKQQPFQGYFFRVPKAGDPATGGTSTHGFAFLAYPAEYRSSGVMTFMVDQNGIVYEKDLGHQTAEIAKTLTRHDRDATWRKAE
jgi:hypothetical protein